MTKRAFLFIISLCAALYCASPAQTPSGADERLNARRDGVITGRVVTNDGQPLSEAHVVAIGVGGKRAGLQPVPCDEEGNFKLIGLRQGVYLVLATMPGYVTSEAAAESNLHRVGDHVLLTLIKGGVITGRVTDAYGEPLVGVHVTTRRVRAQTDRANADEFSAYQNHVDGRLTDDRGVYRIYGLNPGRYVVSVDGSHLSTFGAAHIPRDTPTYHPSATREAATEIVVRPGEEAVNIDLRHREARGHTISGTVTNQPAADSPFAATPVFLLDAMTGQHVASAMMFDARGFAIQGVADGEYELVAESISESNSSFERHASARRRVTIKGADVTGLDLKLVKLGSIAGRVVLEPVPARPVCFDEKAYTRAEISLRAQSVEPSARAENYLNLLGVIGLGQTLSVPDEKGQFVLPSLAAGQYQIVADLPSDDWYLRRITQPAAGAVKKPIDAARQPLMLKPGENLSGLEIIIANGAAQLRGRVLPSKEGAKLPLRLRVHLLPAEVEAADDVLRYYETETRVDGSFAFKHLAPGQYHLLARAAAESEARVEQARPLAWDKLARAQLLREAIAVKHIIELQSCQRLQEQTIRYAPSTPRR